MRAAAAGSLAADAATVEAIGVLAEAGLDALLLKGPATAQLLYAPGDGRTWVDADLMVDPERHEQAIEVLRTIGFAPKFSDPLERGSVAHAVQLVRRPADGEPEAIDLHLSFSGIGAAPSVLWESLRSGREEIELFGRPVGVPSTPARLAMVALHVASHGRDAIVPRGDLERALSRFGRDEWAAAAALAEEWRALDYFVVGLGLDPAGARLVEELAIEHRPGTAAVMRGEGMPRAQRSLEQLARTRGTGARLRLIVRKAFPSAQVMRAWQPLAGRGRAGLALAYAWRPFWLVWQLGPALRSWLRARR